MSVEENNRALASYRAAIAEKFPALALDSLEYLSEGWESVAVVVNSELIFRFPKRALTQQSLRTEIRLLPELAKYLPLPIPQFQYIGDLPGKHVPFTFVGYPMIKGATLEEWPVEVCNENWWKVPLAEFLTALHAFPVERARKLGVLNLNQVLKLTGEGRMTEPTNWREMVREFYDSACQKVFPLISDELQKGVTNRFESFLADERHFEFEPTLIHADFSEDHVVVNFAAQKINGIIDFGDVAIGDPALDVWPSLIPYYGGKVDETFEERYTFYQQMFGPLNLIIFGQAYHDTELVEMGLQELEVELRSAE